MEFLSQYPLYVVLIIALAVWLGIYVYLFRIEARIRELEKQLRK